MIDDAHLLGDFSRHILDGLFDEPEIDFRWILASTPAEQPLIDEWLTKIGTTGAAETVKLKPLKYDDVH
ncbi:MAG: hypothetical protein ABEK29_05700, partial [Bradymonadaceae bacterium]